MKSKIRTEPYRWVRSPRGCSSRLQALAPCSGPKRVPARSCARCRHWNALLCMREHSKRCAQPVLKSKAPSFSTTADSKPSSFHAFPSVTRLARALVNGSCHDLRSSHPRSCLTARRNPLTSPCNEGSRPCTIYFSLPLRLCFLLCPSRTRLVAIGFAGGTMTDAVWVGALTLLVLVYLVYALLVPEKF